MDIEYVKIVIQIVGLVLGSSGLLMFFYTIKRYNRIRKLKREKSILEPISKLQIKDFYEISVEQDRTHGIKTTVTYRTFYRKLQYVLHNVRISELKNKEIKEQLNTLFKADPKTLIITDTPPITFFSFSPELDKIITDTRLYLSEVL